MTETNEPHVVGGPETREKTTLNQLVDEARRAARAAHAPYSGFGVGAVVITGDGRRFTGANVENAAFASSMCAEAVAIATAVTAGSPDIRVVAVASAAGAPSPPCGNCRQIMNEFGVHQIVLEDSTGAATAYELDALLPQAFGSAELRRSSPTTGSR